jgi:hypothetical protein
MPLDGPVESRTPDAADLAVSRPNNLDKYVLGCELSSLASAHGLER